MTDFAFPQDHGIGTHPSGSGDKNDAANFAAVYDAIGKTDHVKQGMAFTVDYGAPSVDISSGKAVVTDSSAMATQEGEDRDEGVAFVVELDERTGLSLSDGAVNHVFLDLSLGSEDATSFHIDTDNTPPSQPYLKVGEIDTSSDSKRELNRAPSEEFESISTGVSRTERHPVIDVDSFGAVGDGETDDYQAIQDAADSLDEGDTSILSFTPGKHYYISDTVTINADEIRTVNGNNAALVIDGDYTALEVVGNKTSETAGPGSSDNKALRGEEFHTKVKDLQIFTADSGYVGSGIHIRDTFGTEVQGCFITEVKDAIRATDINRNLSFEGNLIYDNGRYGLYFSDSLHQCNIYGNHISYFEKGIVIDSGAMANFQIAGNCIEASDSGGAGAPVNLIHYDGAGDSGEIVITGNNIQDHNTATDSLVKVSNVQRSTVITGNYITLTDTDGIKIVDCNETTITGNVLDRIGGDAIVFDSEFPTTLESVVISSNSFRNVTRCVNAQYNVEAFAAVGNSIHSSGSGFNLEILNTISTAISGNVAKGMTGQLVNLEADGMYVLSTSIVDNVAHYESGVSSPDAINVTGLDGVDLRGLIVTGNAVRARSGVDNGISISAAGAANGVIVKNNVVEGASTAFDLPDNSASDVITSDNIDY